jgi:hypothetical protein
MEFHHPHSQLPPRPDSSIFVRPSPRAAANPPGLPPGSSYSLPPPPSALPAQSTAYAPYGYRESRPVIYEPTRPYTSVSSAPAPAPVSVPPSPSYSQPSPLLMGGSSGHHLPHVNHGSQGQNQSQNQNQRGYFGNRGLNTVYSEGEIQLSFNSFVSSLRLGLVSLSLCCPCRARWDMPGLEPNGCMNDGQRSRTCSTTSGLAHCPPLPCPSLCLYTLVHVYPLSITITTQLSPLMYIICSALKIDCRETAREGYSRFGLASDELPGSRVCGHRLQAP